MALPSTIPAIDAELKRLGLSAAQQSAYDSRLAQIEARRQLATSTIEALPTGRRTRNSAGAAVNRAEQVAAIEQLRDQDIAKLETAAFKQLKARMQQIQDLAARKAELAEEDDFVEVSEQDVETAALRRPAVVRADAVSDIMQGLEKDMHLESVLNTAPALKEIMTAAGVTLAGSTVPAFQRHLQKSIRALEKEQQEQQELAMCSALSASERASAALRGMALAKQVTELIRFEQLLPDLVRAAGGSFPAFLEAMRHPKPEVKQMLEGAALLEQIKARHRPGAAGLVAGRRRARPRARAVQAAPATSPADARLAETASEGSARADAADALVHETLAEEWLQSAAAEAAADVMRRAAALTQTQQQRADSSPAAQQTWFGPDGVKLRTAAWQAHGFDSAAIRNEIVWQFDVEPSPNSVRNHSSARQQQQQLGAHLAAMLRDGIIEAYDSAEHGPESAFATVVNPLHVVPKGDSIRPIIDPTASGVNACMRQLPCKLPDLAELLQHLPQYGYLGKRDLASGFHHCVLAPEARRFMAFRNPATGALQRYVALPFGASQSPAIFCELTAAATTIFQSECDRRGLQVRIFTYCDDFMIIGQQHADVVGAFAVMDVLGAELGFTWKLEKDQGRDTACQQLEFLGMMFDTVRLEMRITPDKRQRYAAAIRALLDAAEQGAVQRQDLESVAGKLTFVARACRWGYTFLQSVYDALFSLQQPAPRVLSLEPAALEDLQWWWEVLRADSSVWDGARQCTVAELELVRGEFADAQSGAVIFTDASGAGFGAAWEEAELQGVFSAQQRQSHIAWLELTAVVRALQTWAPRLKGRRVLVRCDNTQAVAAVNHGSTRVKEGRSLCRQLAELAMQAGFEVRAEHIAGVANTRADRLSRQLAQARDQNLRLKPAVFRSLVTTDGGQYRPTVDCCADVLGLNAQPGCAEFFSPERSVLGQEQRLAGKVLWAFPPVSLTGEVLATIAAAAQLDERTRATVVVPYQPSYPWFQQWASQRLAYKTLQGNISALADWQRSKGRSGEDLISQHPLVRRTMATLQRGSGGSQQKAPLPISLLRRLIAWLAQTAGLQPNRAEECSRDACWLALGFFGMLRRSELAGLALADVSQQKAEGPVTLTVRRSKTDQQGLGAQVQLAATTQGSKVPIGRIVSRLRRGGATTAANAGVPLEDIQEHGRWKSDAVRLYIKKSGLEKRRTTERM
eukprot:XP_001691170.1 predicted protein [Chlamydomonas reinhardtii]